MPCGCGKAGTSAGSSNFGGPLVGDLRSRLSKRATGVAPSPTMRIDGLTKELLRKGVDVVSFGAGEPDFDTPDYIKEAAYEAIRKGFNKYAPTAGVPELKEAICRKLREENGLDYQPSQILVTVGAKHAVYNAIQALVDEGDEVVVPAPYWVSYTEQIRLAGGTPVIVETTADRDYKLEPGALKRAIGAKTKALILNSPNNPTGAVYSRSELQRIAEICVEAGVFVISDEIYEKMVYDGAEHVSIASLGQDIKALTVVINGLSKAYAMTGWRIGYAAAEPEIVKAMTDIQSHCTSGATTAAQMASVTALMAPEGKGMVASMVAEFDRRRKFMVERLNRIPGFKTRKPQGAFYVFPDVSGIVGREVSGERIRDDAHLAEVLLERARVSVVPGAAFGYPNHLRLSYATSYERIAEGLERIEKLLAGG